MGLGAGVQISASVPFDVRAVRIDYTNLDGDPYAPPYAEIHHRDETLAGPVDGRLLVRRFARTSSGLVWGGGVGVSVPLGRTEADPYRLTAQGLVHQHLQMGSGTVDPLVTAFVWKSGEKWGVMAGLDGRAGLYANPKGYRPPTMAGLSVGPTYRASSAVTLIAGLELQGETPEQWNGVDYGGRTSLIANAAATWSPSPTWTVQADVRTTAWQHDRGGADESVRQALVGTGGVTFTPPRADKE